jgi:hypothetical protein
MTIRRPGMALVITCGLMASPLGADADRHSGLSHTARVAGLDATDLRRAQEGQAVARTLAAGDARDVVAVGAISVPASRERVIASLRDIMLTKSAVVPQIGRFSAAPSVTDLEPLIIDASDLDDLRDCTPTRCKIHLPVDIVNILNHVNADNKASAADDRRARMFKAFVAERTRAYLDRGRNTLAPYALRTDADSPAADIDALLTASAPYLDLAPGVARHLRHFPHASPDVDDALYWSKEQFGLKPLIRVTHFAIGPIEARGTDPIVAASLQIYASHYVDASLNTIVLLGGDRPGQDCHVIYVSRARTKATAGRFGGITRRIIESRARDGLRRFLETLKTRSAGAAAES